MVIPSVNEARADDLTNRTVIVIDVLRATSTMLTALAHGCKEIYPVETVLQAKQLQQPDYLMGGERSCKKIPGFDLGNSPYEYMDERIAGKTIIITTTNGTRAIQKACKAGTIMIGSLLNGRACAKAAAAIRKDIVILCSGTQDVYALEDGLCAGQLVDELLRIPTIQSNEWVINDMGLSLLYAFRHTEPDITGALLASSNGKRLGKLGFGEDVRYCAQMNLLSIVPVLRDGKLIVPN